MADRSIVEYFAEHEGYKCGYCKAENTAYSHGMWAHKLTPMDYQNLIDRGWRRSGKYCYKPTLNLICCPQYTIRCEAKRFVMSKSHKKVAKKFNRFLIDGRKEKNETPQNADDSQMEISDVPCSDDIQSLKNIANVEDIKSAKLKVAMTETDCDKAVETEEIQDRVDSNSGHSADLGETSSQSPQNNSLPSPSHATNSEEPKRPPCRKAKDIRRERRIQKLLQSGKSMAEIANMQSVNPSQPKRFEEFVNPQLPSTCAHKLELRLVPSDLENPLFSVTFEESHSIYQKYQMHIHKDPAEKCSQTQFIRFLVNSPFQHSEGSIYGSFHQQYWLDGKLIAVGVLDVLPFCVSSVYLYYDPDYSFLSLGTYAALKEIALVRELNKNHLDLQYYYMGYYIHSCIKMRYKGQYFPSYLLCPETYAFQEIEKCKPKLDISKYHRLAENLEKGDPDGAVDLKKLMILYSRQPITYPVYQRLKKGNDEEVIRQYAKLVGKKCYRKMLLYRN